MRGRSTDTTLLVAIEPAFDGLALVASSAPAAHRMCSHIHICIYMQKFNIYIYVYIYTNIHVYIYTYIYVY